MSDQVGLTVVLENMYHPHNTSGVVGSCDCFGCKVFFLIGGR